VVIDQGIGDVTGQSNVSVAPSHDTTYTLTAQNDAGSVQAQATIRVLPAINSLDATPAAVDAGDSTMLSWSVSGAAFLSIDNGIGPVAGSQITLTPPYTTIYSLAASNDAGQVVRQVSVIVRPLLDVQPTNQTIHYGQTATYVATVHGGRDGGVGFAVYGVGGGGGLHPPCPRDSMAGPGTVDCHFSNLELSDAGLSCVVQATSFDDPTVTETATISCGP